MIALGPVAAELILAALQASRMYHEYAERAAAGTMTEDELLDAWADLERDKVQFRIELAKKKAQLMAKANSDSLSA